MSAVALALVALLSFRLDRSFRRELFHALPQRSLCAPDWEYLLIALTNHAASALFCAPAENSESSGFGSWRIQELGPRTRRAAALMPLDEAC
jgi:hypothetical protein